MSDFNYQDEKSVKEQAKDFGLKIIDWIRNHPKDTIIIGLVVVILLMI